tara:strand:- start:279 stop:536 length:258 start_codon:yes stop_codon:yes gene_type:complete
MRLPYRWKWVIDLNLKTTKGLENAKKLFTELTHKQSDENLNKIRNHVITRSSDFEWGDEERDSLIKELDRCIEYERQVRTIHESF